MTAAAGAERLAWVLSAGVALAAGETFGLMVILGCSGAPLAPFVIGALVLKLPFCWLARQRRPGALMGLFLWEIGGALAALRAEASAALRLGELAVAIAVMALLLASVPLFPSVRLPEVDP
jgi:hypothetical protein